MGPLGATIIYGIIVFGIAGFLIWLLCKIMNLLDK
jgi:hypothetical protein